MSTKIFFTFKILQFISNIKIISGIYFPDLFNSKYNVINYSQGYIKVSSIQRQEESRMEAENEGGDESKGEEEKKIKETASVISILQMPQLMPSNNSPTL